MLTQDQIDAAISECLPSVLEGLKASIIKSATYDAENAAREAIRAQTVKFVQEHVIPEVQSALIESKDGLIAVAPAFAKVVAETLLTEITKDLQKKLSSGWGRQKIMEAMFK